MTAMNVQALHLTRVACPHKDHVRSLRRSELMPTMALAMYEGLQEQRSAPALGAHWISARLAFLAAEELLRQGRRLEAFEAARQLRCYVRRTLGRSATRATAFVSCVEAAVLKQRGEHQEAFRLCLEAREEATLLPRSGDQVMELIEEVMEGLKVPALS